MMNDTLLNKGDVNIITTSDVIRYNKAQLRRAKANLVNAEKRKDKRAIENIKRKMLIFSFTCDVMMYYHSLIQDDLKKIQEAGA